MAYLAFLYFVDLDLVFRARAVTNHFPDRSIFTFDSEYVVSILSRLSNVKMEGSGKCLVTALDLKTKARSTKYKKARYDIGNVSMKDLVNKIIEFENFVKVAQSWFMFGLLSPI